MATTAPPDILIIGLGIGGATRMTHEATSALQRARVIFHHSHLGAVIEELAPNAEVRSLETVYAGAGVPSEAYRTMAELVVERALSDAPVAFATYGHPLWFVTPSRLIMKGARARGLTTSVIPGISSLDTILVDAPVILDFGFSAFDATDYVDRRLPATRSLPLVLFQLGDFASQRLRPSHTDVERFEPLAARLLEDYPPSWPVAIVVSAWDTGMTCRTTYGTVGSFAELCQHAHVGTTLVVPSEAQLGYFEQLREAAA